MDKARFLEACRLRDSGRLKEALEDFRRIVEGTSDPIERAGVLLNAIAIHRTLREFEVAHHQLETVRQLISRGQEGDGRVLDARIMTEIEEADVKADMGRKVEAAADFRAIAAHYASVLGTADFSEARHLIQMRRGILEADLGNWAGALSFLEEENRFQGHRPVLSFYLGSCYAAVGKFAESKKMLVEALETGLPANLEFRAHCSLGMTCYKLGDFVQAKSELEKCAETGDAAYVKEAGVWHWLQSACMRLGLNDEAKRYKDQAG